MNDVQTPVVTQAATEPLPASSGLPTTVTQYQQLAAQLKSAIAAVLTAMPAFEQPGSTNKPAPVHIGVPVQFVATTAAAMSGNEIGVAPHVFDPADAQNVLQFVEAFKPLVDDAAALAAKLDLAVKSQFSRVAAGALNAYAIARRIARNGDPGIQIHVRNMRRDLGLRGRRPRVNPAPAPTEPSPKVA